MSEFEKQLDDILKMCAGSYAISEYDEKRQAILDYVAKLESDLAEAKADADCLRQIFPLLINAGGEK